MPHERPNILLVIADQWRGDCLSIDGHPCVQTPNLDAIAHRGARFRRAYSACPSCVPTRRSLLCGQMPATNGMVGMQGDPSWNPEATLPGELTRAGYQTGFVGRTMHQEPAFRRYGYEEFDLSWKLPEEAPYSDYQLELMRATGETHPFASHGVDFNGAVARPWHLDEALHETNWTTNRAIRWLQKRDPSRPFFLTVSYFHPHPPLVPLQHYFDRYLGMDLPEATIGDWANRPANDGFGLGPASDVCCLEGELLRQAQAGYFGLITHLDDQISRLLGHHTGVSHGVMANTILTFTSDHGEMLGDHFLFRKTYPYEGSARVPMLFRGPGIAPEAVNDRPVTHADLMPTFLDFAGADIPQGVDGENLAPLLRGDVPPSDDRILHGEHAICYRPEQANHYLVSDTHKYIWFSQTGEEHLFDLVHDPGETNDLISDESQADIWRNHLIARLRDRPEGFTDGEKLVVGRPHRNLVADGAADAAEMDG